MLTKISVPMESVIKVVDFPAIKRPVNLFQSQLEFSATKGIPYPVSATI